jgi:hypothetical protein
MATNPGKANNARKVNIDALVSRDVLKNMILSLEINLLENAINSTI